ncbi:hypothetical protein BCEP27_120003 [Burkholderia cepacia]
MTISRQRQSGPGSRSGNDVSSGRSTACFSTETFGSDSAGRSRSASREVRNVKGRAAMAHDLLHDLCAAESVRGGTAQASGGERLQAIRKAGTEAGRQAVNGQSKSHPLNTLHRSRCNVTTSGKLACCRLFRTAGIRAAQATEWT